ETWAHYFLMLDTLDTALDFGMARGSIGLLRQPPQASEPNRSAGLPARQDHRAFAPFIEAWTELTGMLNELSRSMGVADFYPFVLSRPTVRKLHLVHRVIASACG
ncbi:MAG: putative zinc-binding metallopeptidase, partial [Rubrivivax sp.]